MAVLSITPNVSNIKSETLKKDLKQESINEELVKEFSEKEMKVMKSQVIKRLKAIDKKRKNPYHNTNHTLEVHNRTQQLLKKVNVTKSDAQVVEIAALFHDYDHSGSPQRKGKFTNEEVAAIKADNFAKDHGFSLHQRVTLYGLIIATTFGNPNIKPHTKLEKLIVSADLSGFINPKEKWLEQIAYVYQEMSTKERPKTLKETMRSEQAFLNYVGTKLTPEAKQLWGDKFKEKQKLLTSLDNRDLARKYLIDTNMNYVC